MMWMNTTFDERALTDETLTRYADDGYLALPSLLSPVEVHEVREALTSVMLRILEDGKSGRADYRPPVQGGSSNYDGAWITVRGEKQTALLFERDFDPLVATQEDALAHLRKLQYYENEHPVIRSLVDS